MPLQTNPSKNINNLIFKLNLRLAQMSNGAAHYGVKSLKQMRIPSQQTAHNSRLVNKISSTSDYFLEKVDPLVGQCISYLLSSLPADVPRAMHSYFVDLKSGVNRQDIPSGEGRWPRKEQKVYLATMIGPIIAKLVNRIAFSRPQEVLEFLLVELEQMISDDSDTTGPIASASVNSTVMPSKGRPDSAPVLSEKIASPRISQANSCSHLPSVEKREARVVQVAVLGMGSAGKTSILNLLQGEPAKKTRPTVGFNPVTMMLDADTTVRFYDLGGGDKIREIWSQYFYDVHAVMFVVDASSTSGDLQESASLANATLQHPQLSNKPVLVVANKQDLSGSLSAEGVKHAVNLSAEVEHLVVGCSAGGNEAEPGALVSPTDIERGLEWLLDNVHSRYQELQQRVSRDSEQKMAQEAAKRLEKERRVLRNKIASAFPALVDVSMLPEGCDQMPEDVFSEADGLAFLAGEVGVDRNDLPAMAVQAAGLVGYQRLALQMIGALNVPVSKKKQPLSWDAIVALVRGLRQELGLP